MMRRELTKEERMQLEINDNHPSQAFARHYANPDGTYTTEVYMKPVKYRVNDDWADIDTTLEDEPGFGRKVKKAWHNLRFWGQKLRFGFGKGVFVDYDLPGSPAFTADTATIIDAWPQTDLVYKSLPEGVKADFVLKSATAPNTFVFPVSLTGITATVKDNALDYVETLTGKVVGRVQPPFAIDANGAKGEVMLSWDGQAITFTVDKTWLDAPERAWPVTVDPTTVIQPDETASKDTYIWSANPTTNYGNNAECYLAQNGQSAALLQFDLSSVPAGKKISSAILTLTQSRTVTYTGVALAAYINTQSWSETTVTWNTAPTYAAQICTVISGYTIPDMDITTAVTSWYSGTLPNYGLRIHSTNNVDERGFYSSGYSTASARPKLTITYYDKPTASISAPNGSQSSPTLQSNLVSVSLQGVYTSSNGNMVSRQHKVLDESGNVVWDSGEVSASATSGQTVTVTTPVLEYGRKYYWLWRAKDAYEWSDWSPAGWFQCVMTAPTGLVLTSIPSSANIIVAWDTHPAESLAGYNVYRRKVGDATWIKQNQTLIVGPSYTDAYAAGEVIYEYQVTAVSTTGYESPASTSIQGSVTIMDWWLGSVKLDSVTGFNFSQGRKQTIQNVWGKDYPLIQDFGKTGKQLLLKATIRGESNYQAFEAQWKQTTVMGLRDPFSRAWKVKPVGEIQAEQMKGTGQADYIVSFTLREVAG